MALDEIFKCKQCGDCCKGYGGTFIYQDDIDRIALFLNISPDEFIRTCCDHSGKQLTIAQRNDGYCMFWDSSCKIHPVKPKMCKAWPFIEGVLKDPFNWRIMASACPGMNPTASDETIYNVTKNELAKL